jgi:hypothetical protein
VCCTGTAHFLPPVDHTLRAIFLERSGARRAFYVWVFFQVLCVPSDIVYFNLGWRLENRRWSTDNATGLEDLAAAIRNKGLPFLEPIQTPRDAALAAKLIHHLPYDEVQRAVAYAFARNGDRQQAIRELESYLAAHAELQSDLDYVVARVAEARALKEQLLKEPSAALRQLQEWEDATRAALGLREYNFLSDVLKHGV